MVCHARVAYLSKRVYNFYEFGAWAPPLMFALALNLNRQNLQLQLQGSVRRSGFRAAEKR